jgi:hypothetical protein
MFRGEYALAVSDAQRGIKLYDPARHHRLAATFGGHDPGVCAYTCAGMSGTLRGYPIAGLSLNKQGVVLGESLEHPHSIAHGLLVAALTCACARDIGGLRAYAPRLRAVAEKFNFLPYAAVAAVLSQMCGDSASESLDKIKADFLRARALTPLPIPLTAFMAERLANAGHPTEALDVIDDMLTELKSPAIGFYLSELHRLRAEALCALQREDEARSAGNQALEIARGQNARLLELRTQCTRARFGDPEAERDLLECIATWPDNEACADLVTAKSLVQAPPSGRSTENPAGVH